MVVTFPCGNIENLTCLAVSCKCTKFKQNIPIELLKDTFDLKKAAIIIGGAAIK